MSQPQLWLHEVERGHVADVAYTLTGSKAALAYAHGVLQVRELKSGADAIPTLLQVNGTPTCVTWAHDEFGEVLVCGTSTGQLLVWEHAPGPDEGEHMAHGWQLRAELKDHNCYQPVRCLCFCPKQAGLLLSAGYADGWVRCWEADTPVNAQHWRLHSKMQAGSKAGGGCTCLSWRGFTPGLPPLLCVGTGSGASVWVRDEQFFKWMKVLDLMSGEAVSALHWAPLMGRPTELLAAATGRRAEIYSLTGSVEELQAHAVAVLEHKSAVWRVEFNLLGNSLATGTRDAIVSLWKPNLMGQWQLQGEIHGKPDDAMAGDEAPPAIAGHGGAFSDMVD